MAATIAPAATPAPMPSEASMLRRLTRCEEISASESVAGLSVKFLSSDFTLSTPWDSATLRPNAYHLILIQPRACLSKTLLARADTLGACMNYYYATYGGRGKNPFFAQRVRRRSARNIRPCPAKPAPAQPGGPMAFLAGGDCEGVDRSPATPTCPRVIHPCSRSVGCPCRATWMPLYSLFSQ